MADDHHVNALVRVHRILAVINSERVLLHVFDETGSIHLQLPLTESMKLEALIPGRTVLSLENVACVLVDSHLTLVVPDKLRYARVYIYDENDEVSGYCSQVEGSQLQELTVLRSMSIYKFKVKEI